MTDGAPSPAATRVVLVDPRRLTGPNLLVWRPLVVVELTFKADISVAEVTDAYLEELARMRVALGWAPDVKGLVVRPHEGGAVIGYEAELDLMLACTEMNEWAAWSVGERFEGRAPLPIEPKRAVVAEMLAKDESLPLRALEKAARAHDLPFLWDDEAVSIGAGIRSVTWARPQLPAPEDVAWDTLGAIPIALVTGTNGKTTTTRLLARVAREAGRRVGMTSSDAVTIGDKVIETGDWTGPAAARIVLRSHDVDFAVLETARGGILRRGLAVAVCDAAILTNVSEDHSGYGIDDLAQMAQVKAVAGRAVRRSGTVVLNAHDPHLVALAPSFDANVTFFADLDRDDLAARELIAKHRAEGKRVVVAENGELQLASLTLRLADLPITFGGAARHNIENVLGVTAMALALDLPEGAIAAGLRGFGAGDNPRRGEMHERGGVKILLDFAHNPAGVRNLMKLVTAMRNPSGRLIVIAGSAGDRRDEEILAMCDEIVAAKPTRVLIRELTDYLRGRDLGEVPALFDRTLTERDGLSRDAVEIVGSEVEALQRALDGAEAGDFVVMLVHLDYEAVHAFLAS